MKQHGYISLVVIAIVLLAALLAGGISQSDDSQPFTTGHFINISPAASNKTLQFTSLLLVTNTPTPTPLPPFPTTPDGVTLIPNPSPTLTSTPIPCSGSTTVTMTFYTAKFPGLSHSCIHPQGGGIGTFQDPISFASPGGTGDYPWCAIIYVPRVKKYFIHENSCPSCSKIGSVDLYLGSNSNSNTGQACAGSLTQANLSGSIIVNPPSTLSYDPTPIFTPPNTCMPSQCF